VLERFGVDVLDETLYRALLVEPEATLDRLAVTVGMDLSRLPQALARLSELGLILIDGSATCEYSPQAPQYALELLIQREEQRLELERLRLHEVRATIPDLVDEYVALRARILGPEVEVLDDAALVRARLFQLHREAKSSAWAVHPGGPLAASEIDQALPLD